MTDSERFAALLNAEYPCACINTTEEDEARRLVCAAFIDRAKPLFLWTASDGIRDGLVKGAGLVADTEHPAAACTYLRAQTWIPGQGAIFRIHLAKRKRNPDAFDLAALAAAAEGYSGAEIEQAVISGLFDAFSAKTDLTTKILITTLRNSPPLSVTMAERIDELRAWSRGRCMPADDLPSEPNQTATRP